MNDPFTPYCYAQSRHGWRIVYPDGSWRMISVYEVALVMRRGESATFDDAVVKLARAYKRLEAQRLVA